MYDLLVIGAGPGGYTAAIKAAKNGLKTAVVEAETVGGTCLNKGCIPTKFLVSEMHKYSEAIKNIESGVYSGKIFLNYSVIKDSLYDKIISLVDGIELLLKNCGAELIRGHAEFVDSTHVRINESGKLLEAKSIIIATGSSPKLLDISCSGMTGRKRVFTTDNIFTDLDHVPESIAIVGAGAVGLELAFIYSGFGSKVTIIEQRDSIFGGIDPDVDTEVMKMLRRKNINILLNCSIDSIFADDERITVFDDNEDELSISEIIVFALGRTPNIGSIRLDNANITVSNGRIDVDDHMRTSCANVFAIGDVNGINPLAYAATAQAENVVSILCGDDDFKDTSIVPICVFTANETAFVGLSVKEAKEKHIGIKTAKFLMTANGRSKVDDNDGFIKIIADENTDVILGGVCVCHNASELISYITYAVKNKLTVKEFTSVIFPHPTYSESLSEAAGLVNNKCIYML